MSESNVTLGDEIAAKYATLENASEDYGYLIAVALLRPKLDAANAEIARLEATWKAERDLANRIASRLFRERGAKQRAEAALAKKDAELLDMYAYTAEFNVYREQLAQMTKELAEKDVEIARLKAALEEAKWETAAVNHDVEFSVAKGKEMARLAYAESRTVTDAQRKLDAIAALPRYHVEGATGLPLTVVYARDVDAILNEQPAAEVLRQITRPGKE